MTRGDPRDRAPVFPDIAERTSPCRPSLREEPFERVTERSGDAGELVRVDRATAVLDLG